MQEEKEEQLSDKVSRWLLTRLGATLATVVAALIPALTVLPPQETQTKVLWGVVLGLGLLAAFSLWTATIVLGRQRSRISKLEREILSLQSRPSPALKDATERDRVLVAVHESGNDDSKLAKVTQPSQARVDACLHELVQERMVDIIMQPWETAYHVVIPKGRSYLLGNHLIE